MSVLGGYIRGPAAAIILPSSECVISKDGYCIHGHVEGHDPWNAPTGGQHRRFWVCAKLDDWRAV